MKFAFSTILLASLACGLPQGDMGDMGNMPEMMEKYGDQFMMKLAPILMKMGKAKMEMMSKMPEKPNLEEALKTAVCYGSEMSEKMCAAKEKCMPSCDGDMEEMMGSMEMDMPMMGGQDMKDKIKGMMAGMKDMMGNMKDMMKDDGKMDAIKDMMSGMKDIGEDMGMMMMKPMLEMKKCFLTELGWIDDMCMPNREAMKMDLNMTPLAEMGLCSETVDQTCWDMSRMISADCLEGDMTEGLTMMVDGIKEMLMNMKDTGDKGDMPMGEETRRKGGKKGGKGKKPKETEEMPMMDEGMIDEMVLGAVQNLAYFECMHMSAEMACCGAMKTKLAPIFGDMMIEEGM